MKPSITAIRLQVQQALDEDIGSGDVTAQLIADQRYCEATIISRESAIICGVDWVNEVFQQLDQEITLQWQVSDGDRVKNEQHLCQLRGPAHSLLSGERTALNFLQTLSATATQTQLYVAAVAGTGCRILDTRKTIPGLRLAQKYAVSCGGGVNHRCGLYDMVLIKENHIMAAGGILHAVAAARQQHPDIPIEVEVENLQELQQALQCNVDRIMLDNMDIQTLQQAVSITRGRCPLEASGNVELSNVRQIAETGVNYISTGAITKNIQAIDLSMRFK